MKLVPAIEHERVKQLTQIKQKAQQFRVAISSCLLCGQAEGEIPYLCQHCYRELPQIDYQHLEGDLLNWPPVAKALKRHQFDQLICLSPHHWPINAWVSQLKYQRHFDLAPLLAHLLARAWQQLALASSQTPTLICSVPLHPSRWRERGYNQAHLLAKKFAKIIAIPYDGQLLTRNMAGESQVGQSGKARRKNLKNAFSLNTKARLPDHIMLVDDVVTTGSTANEISRLLKRHGVTKVTLCTLSISL